MAESSAAAATAAATITEGGSWDEALGAALGQVGDALATTPDLVLLFASPAYADAFQHMAAVTHERTGAQVLAGCSGQGVIGPAREIEDRPAVSLLAASMPGGALRATHITQPFVAACRTAEDWRRLSGVAPYVVNGWLIFADPFTLDVEALYAGLAEA